MYEAPDFKEFDKKRKAHLSKEDIEQMVHKESERLRQSAVTFDNNNNIRNPTNNNTTISRVNITTRKRNVNPSPSEIEEPRAKRGKSTKPQTQIQ